MATKKQIVTEFRRREIVDAARSIFAREGFANGVMDDIAKEAKIAKGTLYLYFRSKKEVYRAVLDEDMETLKRTTIERIDAAKTLREKVKAFILTRFENAEAKREFFQIMDSEFGGASFTRSQYRSWLAEPVVHLAAAIKDESESGEIRAVPAEKVAWMIADMTRGIIQRSLLGQPRSPLNEEAEILLNFVWAALANPRRSRH
jgi:AcrR family transcriptional regulator